MDVFSSLSSGLQNLIYFNYTYNLRLILFFVSYIVCIFYLAYWKPYKEKKTPFYSVGIMRVIVGSFSYSLILFFPLLVLFLSPSFLIDTFLTIYYIIYGSYLGIVIFMIGIDVFIFLPNYVMALGGFELKSPRVQLALRKIRGYKK